MHKLLLLGLLHDNGSLMLLQLRLELVHKTETTQLNNLFHRVAALSVRSSRHALTLQQSADLVTASLDYRD